jgi:hypothetical protein
VQPHPEFLRAMQERATLMAAEFHPQSVANTVWALATLGVQPQPEFLSAMQERAVLTAAEFNPQSVSNTVWALATLGVQPQPEFLSAMQEQAASMAGEFDSQSVVNLLWASAVFGTTDDATRVPAALISRCLELELSSVLHLCQIHQYLLFCDIAASSIGNDEHRQLLQQLTDAYGHSAHEAFLSQESHPSALQSTITVALEDLFPGIVKAPEVVDERSGYQLDAELDPSAIPHSVLGGGAARREGRRWGLEVDGPSHFLAVGSQFAARLAVRQPTPSVCALACGELTLASPRRQGDACTNPKGSTLLKRRQLSELGCGVLFPQHYMYAWTTIRKGVLSTLNSFRRWLCSDGF